MAVTPAPCVRALQMILCGRVCHAPRTEWGRIPGGDCMPLGDGYGVFTPCDDGEGYCPAPDCKYHGQCLCLCHTTE